MKKNLIVGNTSQLSHFFPKENNDFISSRNINFDDIKVSTKNFIVNTNISLNIDNLFKFLAFV